jgi:type II secretory pathway component PulJ
MRAVSQFRSSAQAPARGLSLVELMVGITIGLFVVAAAVTLTSNQLVDNRRLLLELQIQQDLRATMDIMTRQLRRAGTNVGGSQNYVAESGLGGLKSTNGEVTPTVAGANQTVFSFVRNAADQGPYGFTLDAGNGVVITNLGGNNPQELTDRSTMRVRNLTFTAQPIVSARLPCPKLCPDGSTDCWPELVIQRITIDMTAEARSDPRIQRSLASDVRVRNDWVRDSTAANTRVCPS